MIDKTWSLIQQQISIISASDYEYVLVSDFILQQKNYPNALCHLLFNAMKSHYLSYPQLETIIHEAINHDPHIVTNSLLDLYAFQERDPACQNLHEAFLFYKGFKVLQLYRLANFYWRGKKYFIARLIQSITSDLFAVDIHPGAEIQGGIFIDHGTGIVIGETARIDRNVSILHNVTLGGTGKEVADRHPKIKEGVLIGAGAKVLGNITIGKNSKVAAGSIVLADVPEGVTVVGIPAKIVCTNQNSIPAQEMSQLPDY